MSELVIAAIITGTFTVTVAVITYIVAPRVRSAGESRDAKAAYDRDYLKKLERQNDRLRGLLDGLRNDVLRAIDSALIRLDIEGEHHRTHVVALLTALKHRLENIEVPGENEG